MPAVAKQIDQQAAARQQWRLPPPDPEGLQRLLVEMDRPLIDAAVRSRLLRLMQLHGAEHVVLLIRAITESEGNEDALVEPIVRGVSHVMSTEKAWPARGLEWIEAFDHIPLLAMLQAMRAIDLFREDTIGNYYGIALRNKLAKVFGEIDTPSAPPVANRISGARRAIEQGIELLKVKGPKKTSPITRVASDRFGLSASECGQVINAARRYGDRIWLVEKLSRDALFTLAAPSLPASVREAVERRLRAGDVVRAPEVKRLRKGQ